MVFIFGVCILLRVWDQGEGFPLRRLRRRKSPTLILQDMAYVRVLEILAVHAEVIIRVCKIQSNVYPKGNSQCLQNKYYIHTVSMHMQETVTCFQRYSILHFGGCCLSVEASGASRLCTLSLYVYVTSALKLKMRHQVEYISYSVFVCVHMYIRIYIFFLATMISLTFN
jgi:hypothetical protein